MRNYLNVDPTVRFTSNTKGKYITVPNQKKEKLALTFEIAEVTYLSSLSHWYFLNKIWRNCLQETYIKCSYPSYWVSSFAQK